MSSVDREDILNEVIRDLTMLLTVIDQTASENYAGVKVALEWVKAMKDEGM
jgi:hypothetical protein